MNKDTHDYIADEHYSKMKEQGLCVECGKSVFDCECIKCFYCGRTTKELGAGWTKLEHEDYFGHVCPDCNDENG